MVRLRKTLTAPLPTCILYGRWAGILNLLLTNTGQSGAGGESEGGRLMTKGLHLSMFLCSLFGQESLDCKKQKANLNMHGGRGIQVETTLFGSS